MYKKQKLKNGLTVAVSPMMHMESVSISVWIGAGGRYELARESGISHFVEHMLFKGTHTRTAKDLRESVEGVGGAFNGFTSDEVTCYMIKVPARFMELGIDVLADMVLNARFDHEDLQKEKFVICEEIKMYKDQPAEHVLDVLSGIMWPGNALGRPLTGNIATVKKFSLKELIKFRDKNYCPNNIAVIAAGKCDHKKIVDCVSRSFRDRKASKIQSLKTPSIGQKHPRMKICHRGTSQTHMALGFHASGRNIRERFALKLMNIIFGGNMSSRLFEELREKHGLCYDVSSSYKRYSDVGEIQVHAGVDNKKAFKSVIAVLDEIKKLKDLGVTEGELDRAKKYAKGQFLLAMEGTSSRMMWLGDRLMVHKHIPSLKNVVKEIDNVTAADIHRVCGRIFKPSFANLAIVGGMAERDKNKVKRELKNL